MSADKVIGWVDWNYNGIFDAGEESNGAPCASGEVQLPWTAPADIVRSVDGEDRVSSATCMWLRITADNNGNGQKSVGGIAIGEVEDYRVAVHVPALQPVKSVDNKYTTAEVADLGADQWALTGGTGTYTVTGNDTTGGPTVMRTDNNDLSETTADPAGTGYETDQWNCE